MADLLDLEKGDPEAEAAADSRQRRRNRRREQGDDGERKDSTPKRSTEDNLRGRLRAAFGKVAEQMEVRDDEELATALRDEAEAMAAGFDSLTQTVRPLRYPLLILVALIEPVLAFWRVGGILFRRFMARRQRRWEEAQETETPGDPVAEYMNPGTVG